MLLPVWRGRDIIAFTKVDLNDYGILATRKWRLTAGGYVYWGGGGTGTIYMSRLLLGLEKGDKREADHKNRNKLDNRRENLRIVTRRQNCENKTKSKGTSQFKGVHWSDQYGKWRATGGRRGEYRILGHFDDELEAAEVARKYREQNYSHAID